MAQNETPSVTITCTDVTIAAGSTTGMSTMIVAPSDNLGFTGGVNLTAAITSIPAGAKDLPQLSVPPSVVLAGTAALTTEVTISTTPATSSALGYPARPGEHAYAHSLGLALILLLGVGIPARSRRWQLRLGLIFILLLAVGLAGCGGGHSGTTPGVYAVTVTGTTSDSTTATTTFSITVQ